MTTPLSNPRELRVYGPASGYTVTVHGATLYDDLQGTVSASPAPMRDPSGVGLTSFWIDIPAGRWFQLHVVVNLADGTILIDRTLNALPALVDAVNRQVRVSNEPWNANYPEANA